MAEARDRESEDQRERLLRVLSAASPAEAGLRVVSNANPLLGKRK
jgi:hypothetical protein